MDRRPDHLIAEIAARQHGLFTRAQAVEAGVATSTLSWRVGAGRYREVHRGVYALEGSQRGRLQAVQAAVLWVGGEAAAARATAAELHGLPLWPDPRIHVLVRDRSWHGTREVALHRSAWFLEEHIVEIDGIRVTSPARTIVELAGSLGRFQLRKVLRDAVRRGVTDAPEVRACLSLVGRVRGAVQLREELDLLSPLESRTASGLESAFLELTERHGLRPAVECA